MSTFGKVTFYCHIYNEAPVANITLNCLCSFLFQRHQPSHPTVHFISALVHRSLQKAHTKASEATK